MRDGDEIAAIEHCDDVDLEARGNVLNVTVTGEAVERVDARLGERRQVIDDGGVRTVRTPHHRVAAHACGRSTGALDGAGGGGHRPAGGAARRRRRPSTPPAASTPRRCATSTAACCSPPRTSGATTRSTRSSAARCSTAGCRSTDAMLVVSGRTSYELVQKALLGGVPLVAARLGAVEPGHRPGAGRRASRCAASCAATPERLRAPERITS